MNPKSFEQSGRFSPYIKIPTAGGVADNLASDAFCEVLRHHTLTQAEQLLRMCACKEIDDIPPAVRSISQENPQTLQTVENMLIAFRHFLTGTEHADVREKLGVVFQPMAAWVHGKYCVTTPALLVIQSILHSHCEWFREELFESYSALRAYEELSLQGFHDLHCRFVAGIIAHQTLLRAAWTTDYATDPREVWGIYDAYKEKKPVKKFAEEAEQPEVIGIALRRTLLRFVKDNVGQERLNLEQTEGGGPVALRSWSPDSPDLLWRQLAAALVLHSLCLQCRHSRYGSELRRLSPEFKQQALGYLDHMLARERKQRYPGVGLVFFHYGRYASQVRNETTSLFDHVKSMVAGALENDFERSISSEADRHRYNLSFCFERISHKGAWQETEWKSAQWQWPEEETPEKGVNLGDSKLTLKREKLDFGAGSQAVPVSGEDGSEKVKIAAIARLIEDTVGFKLQGAEGGTAQYLKLELPAEKHLVCPEPRGDNFDKVRKWLSKDNNTATIDVIAGLLSTVLSTKFVSPTPTTTADYDYIPTPLIGLVLRQLRELRPNAFGPLHLVLNGFGDQPRQQKQFTVWLPVVERELGKCLNGDSENGTAGEHGGGKEADDKNEVWSGPIKPPMKERDAVLLIARYVAAMVVGHAVSYAPQQILLDYYSDEDRKHWDVLIQKALGENGGPLMETYCTQLRAEPVAFRRADPRSPATIGAPLPNPEVVDKFLDKNEGNKNIIGIDIGGSSVRVVKFPAGSTIGLAEPMAIFSLSKGDLCVKQLSKATLEAFNNKVDSIVKGLSVAPSIGDNLKEFENIEKALAQAFGEKITTEDFVKVVSTKMTDSTAWIDENTIAIGVSLAAPVGKGREVPLSTSGALYTYFGTDNRIAAVRLQDLHGMDIGEALRKQNSGEPVIVRIINDGDADIFDSQTADTAREEGIAIELKAGTGIAVAVRRDGKPWDLKAETAKAILNLAARPDEHKTPYKRFQKGVLSDYCSKNGLMRLTECLFEKVDRSAFSDYINNPGGTFIGPLLRSVLYDTSIPTQASGEDKHWQELKEICGNEWTRISTQDGEADNELYKKACLIAKLRFAVEVESKADGRRRKWLQELSTNNPEPATEEFKDTVTYKMIDWNNLQSEQKFAIDCARRLGYWLADAIALAGDIFEAREVRLAGGPLSGATGIFVTAAAEQALEELYGFDLEVIWDPKQDGGGQFEPLPISRYRVRHFRQLRLHYPPAPAEQGSDQSGARGAAKAAKQAWIEAMRGRQLRKCRDWVQSNRVGTIFSAEEVLKAVQEAGAFSPSLITEQDVATMLAQESAALELTRTVSLDFRKYPRHGEII